MYHPGRPFPSKYETARFVISTGIDFFAAGADSWILPRLEEAPGVDVGYSDDKYTIKMAKHGIGIMPVESGGYMSVLELHYIQSLRNWFQPAGDLSDSAYVGFYKLKTVRQFKSMGECLQLLTRDDNRQCRFGSPAIIVDDSGLGTLDFAPLVDLAKRSGGTAYPASLTLQRAYRLGGGTATDVLELGLSKALADCRSVFASRRIAIPESVAASPLGKMLATQLKSPVSRDGSGSIRPENLVRSRYVGEAQPLLTSLGLILSHLEVGSFRYSGGY